MEKTEPARPSHPALFFFMELPFGAAVGYLSIALPFWLRTNGVSIEEIGALSAIANAPHTFKVAWIPLLDIGSRRKLWYLACVVGTAALLVAVSVLPDAIHHLVLLTVLITAAQVTAGTSSSALNALVAITVRQEHKGRAGGFYMAGNVGGTGLLGALSLWLSQRVSPAAAGLTMAGIVLAAGAFALPIIEPRLVDQALARAGSFGRAVWASLKAVVLDLWRSARSREGFTGLIICLAPVGCGALSNLFSAIAPDFQAPAQTVEWVNGVFGGLASALGSFAGGILADRMNRRVAYAAAGGITGAFALAMAFAPMTPATYAWGTMGYQFALGIAFATWAGMVLEMIGHTPGVTTKYALFTAAANGASSYVTWLDGKASGIHNLGARGTLLADAVLTAVGIAILLAMVAIVRRRPPAPAPA